MMLENFSIPANSENGRAIERLAARARMTPEQFLDRIIDEGIRNYTDPDNYDHLFTPEVVADLRGIIADIRAGAKTYTMDEVDEHFAEKRQAWLAEHPG